MECPPSDTPCWGKEKRKEEPRGQEQPHGTGDTRNPDGNPTEPLQPDTRWGQRGAQGSQCSHTSASQSPDEQGRGGFSPASGPETALKALVPFNLGCAASGSGGRAQISRGKRGKPNSRSLSRPD